LIRQADNLPSQTDPDRRVTHADQMTWPTDDPMIRLENESSPEKESGSGRFAGFHQVQGRPGMSTFRFECDVLPAVF
jgi:hypothetical protein